MSDDFKYCTELVIGNRILVHRDANYKYQLHFEQRHHFTPQYVYSINAKMAIKRKIDHGFVISDLELVIKHIYITRKRKILLRMRDDVIC